MSERAADRRVLIFSDDLGGGTGNHLLALTRRWGSSPWRAEIVSQAPPRARQAPTVPVHVVERKPFERYPLAQLRRLAMATNHARRFQPTLVHSYFFWSIMYGRALKMLGRVKLLVENREDQGFNWGAHEYLLLRATRHAPDRVICVSEAVRQVVLAREAIEPSRVVVIRNGVEIPPSAAADGSRLAASLGLRPEHLVVGMVANFNRGVKGVRHLIEAAPSIVQAVPEVRFLLVGRGDEEPELRRLADLLGVAEQVIFAGYAEDVDAYYRLMSVSVLTSLSEGLSITLLESMGHGLPVVVTDVGGNREVVEDSVTGYLVPPRDTPAFAGRVVALLRDAEARARFGRAARQRVEANFGIDAVARSYLHVYEELRSTT